MMPSAPVREHREPCMCCTGVSLATSSGLLGIQEQNNVLIFGAWEVSVPSEPNGGAWLALIIQARCELSCVPMDPFGVDPICGHRATRCPRFST